MVEVFWRVESDLGTKAVLCAPKLFRFAKKMTVRGGAEDPARMDSLA
jgi:hypothetical protein